MKRFIFVILFLLGIIGLGSITTQAQAPKKKTNLTAKDRLAWYNFLKWPEEYKELENVSFGDDGGLYFDELAPNKYLVTIQAFEPGGYATGYVFTIYDATKPRPKRSKLLEFKCLSLETEEDQPILQKSYESEIWGDISFNRKQKILKVFSRSRGVGDCGSLIYYKFVNDKPVIVEARVRACEDQLPDEIPPPEKWKRVRNP